MVDATQFENLELYRDPNNSDRFIARDPSDNTIYAIPFEEIESTDATITNNLTVNGTTSTQALEAGDTTSDLLSVNDYSSEFDKNTDQSVPPATDTTVDWDNLDVNAVLMSYDSGTDEITIQESGDYQFEFCLRLSGLTDTDLVSVKGVVNGNTFKIIPTSVSGNDDAVSGAFTLNGLSNGDVLRLDISTPNGCTIKGFNTATWMTVSKEA